MFPPKGSNPYGQQQTYGGQQSYGQIPGSGSSGFSSSAATGGADGSRFGARVGQGATGQYGGPYASVYGTQQAGGLGGKGPASSNLPTHQAPLPEPSKFSSGSVGSSMARPNDDYMAVRGYGQKLDQYGTDYTLERRMYGDTANLGRRDGLTDLDRRYPEHISGGHQIHDRMEQGSSMRHQQLLKPQLQSGSDIRQADYFAGRSAPIHQGSQEIGAYGRVEADHRNLSILGTAPYGGQQSSSLLGGAPRTNIDSLSYGQGSSSSGYGMGLPPGRDYAPGKGLLHSSDSDYRDSILSRVHPGISMVDDRAGYRRELDLRDEERRRDLLLEREKERERERERELRDLRDRERERERERDRERLRERERERELERERERLRERRMKERERDRKHPADSRREHTPPRTPGDRRRSTSVRAEKPLRRLSPRRDAVHRHRSPVKEIKREYICKVLPFRLVDNERDYLSLTKRYPRLAIAPDFSKIVLNWTKETLNLSLHTPVSLEHGIHEVDDSTDGAVITSGKASSTKISEVIWNAKVLLMSGMSNSAFADITSLRSTDERVVHLNNILKFAVFKRERSLFAIGGPWNAAIDGGDPSVDCSCLIQTAIRHVKELVQVDLSNCTQWNRFLEVHYNRVGKDGLFSHKEITVLFVPNLSECLPSMDLWKNNWIAYRKSKTEKEQRIVKKEKSPADASKQKQGELSQGKSSDVDQKEQDAGHSATENVKVDSGMDGKDGKENPAEQEKQNLDKVEEKNVNKVEEQAEKKSGGAEGNMSGDASVEHAIENKKPMKKKVVKKVVKVVRKRPAGETSAGKSSQEDKSSIAETASMAGEEQVQQKSEDVVKDAEAKKPVKKKIITRRVIKRKVSVSARDSTAPAETSKEDMEVQPEKNAEVLTDAVVSQAMLEEGSKAPAEDTSKQNKEQEPEEKGQSITVDQKPNGDKDNQQEVLKQKDLKQDGKTGKKDKTKDDKEKKSRDQKTDSKQKSLTDTKDKKKSDEPPKHPGFILQAKRSKDSKVRSTSLSLDGLLDYTANDLEESVFELSLFAESFSEMLQHKMGCVILSFLEKLHRRYVTKRNQRKRQREEDLKKEDKKSSEKRLKTNDETVSESTPHNQRESVETIKVGKKITDHSSAGHDEESNKDETKMSAGHSAAAQDELVKEGKEKMNAEHSAAPHKELIKEGNEKSTEQSEAVHEPGADEIMEDEEPDYEEDPEEVELYEDDEEMDEATAEELVEQNEDNFNDKAKQEVTTEVDGDKNTEERESENNATVHEKSASGGDKQSVAEKSASGEGKQSVSEKGEKAGKEVKPITSQKGDSAKDEVVDKELMQVDDLRCILHNLGKFLSNRDVKDLVQIALVESNSARDNRIIYTKLAKKVDL
uniref:DBC1/CARP1 catalytically inactive NUDIX hydrolase domain-containing protein n=1 Tax=Leersia perrieri TaxID=77586 RepID=A0A0D9WR99_9ORYZ